MDVVSYILAKKYVDTKVQEISDLSPFTYKGAVSNYISLPNDANKGEVYTIVDTGDEYLWSGLEWVKFGNNVTEEMVAAKQDKLTDEQLANVNCEAVSAEDIQNLFEEDK